MDASNFSKSQLISSGKIIKPSSPTPSSLNSYKLSFSDQLTHNSYIPIVLFYPHNDNISSFDTTELLERSLSRLLKSYYPFAGTLKDNLYIDCNDKGVTFLEKRINLPMVQLLLQTHSTVQKIVFPTEFPPFTPLVKDNLVVVQLNHFDCGGKALAICMTHKLSDGSSLSSFLKDWAAMAREEEPPLPQFIGTSIFPPKDTSITPLFETLKDDLYVCKRFEFSGKSIAQLKKLAAAESEVENPTKVEVITAFLCKRAIAATMVMSETFTPSVLMQAVNMRRLTVPPLPQNSIGNLSFVYPTPIINEGEMKLSRFVYNLRRGKLELYEKCKRMSLNELHLDNLKDFGKQLDLCMNWYSCTSFCGYELNHLDFGSGRPIKVVIGAQMHKNSFVLIEDNNGDGIEAVVTMDENVMSIFETDEELLAFYSH